MHLQINLKNECYSLIEETKTINKCEKRELYIKKKIRTIN